MSKIYVYSTLSNDQVYTSYSRDGNGVPKPTRSVFIAGGANIMTKQFVTPQGVATEITAEQLAELKNNEMFLLHQKNGFITVSERKAEIEKVVTDMNGRDESAPLVEQDFGDEDPAISTNSGRGRKGK